MNIKIAMTLGATSLLLAGCVQNSAEEYVSDLRGHSAEFTFHPNNVDNGTEYYYPNSNKVLYLNYDGRCVNGSYTTDGDVIEYKYPNTNIYGIFKVSNHEGQKVLSTLNGKRYQTYEIVSNEPIDCTPIN